MVLIVMISTDFFFLRQLFFRNFVIGVQSTMWVKIGFVNLAGNDLFLST